MRNGRRKAACLLQEADHAGVSESVRLDPREVQELRNTLVVGAQELGVDLRIHRRLVRHDFEPVPLEEAPTAVSM